MTMATLAPSKADNNVSSQKRNNYGKIPFSNVVVRHRPNAFWGRTWNVVDVVYATIIAYMHVLCLFAPFHFTWDAFWTGFALYVITSLFGITLSYHRNLSHYSFRLPKLLEYTFAYCGLQSAQGTPIQWVSTHRFHHKYTDKDEDPHSPINGFWFSHLSWIINQDFVTAKCGERNNAEDLKKQWFYRFLEYTHIFHLAGLGLLLHKFGGMPYLTWAMGVRVVAGYHAISLVNSVCHIWGDQPWKTGDLSKNNWWVALLIFGEGWHNNHHAFASSARHGLEWWQLDMTWIVIKTLEYIGLAKDVKLPSAGAKQRMASKNVEMRM